MFLPKEKILKNQHYKQGITSSATPLGKRNEYPHYVIIVDNYVYYSLFLKINQRSTSKAEWKNIMIAKESDSINK